MLHDISRPSSGNLRSLPAGSTSGRRRELLTHDQISITSRVRIMKMFALLIRVQAFVTALRPSRAKRWDSGTPNDRVGQIFTIATTLSPPISSLFAAFSAGHRVVPTLGDASSPCAVAVHDRQQPVVLWLKRRTFHHPIATNLGSLPAGAPSDHDRMASLVSLCGPPGVRSLVCSFDHVLCISRL